jgi:excinuclease UvrABC ATPase subunit
MTPDTMPRHPADSHDMIQVRGARENNLADISLDIPKRRLTVFTGVSGSGKSSLVFGTIATESRRLINETYTAFLQSFMPSLGRPDVDALHNLSAAIIVDQERMAANARSTVGTATDAYTMLRIIFSRLGRPHIGPSSAFSFNMPAGHARGEVELERGDGAPTSREVTLSGGMCPECEGLGRVSAIDVDELVDVERSLNEGAITVPNFGVGTWYWQTLAHSGFVDPDTKLKDYTPQQWEDFLHKPATKISTPINLNVTYEGLVVKVQRLYLAKDREALQPHIRAFVDRAVTFQRCPSCGGTRLNPTALSSKIKGHNIAQCSAMQISDLAEFVRDIDDPSVGPLVATLRDTLDSMVEVGLGYLSLDRESGTLSGGEAQRVKMVRHLGSALTDVT